MVKCPKCESEHISKYGKKKRNKSSDYEQYYKCNDCNFYFFKPKKIDTDDYLSRLAYKSQKQNDLLREARRIIRELSRKYNTLDELYRSILDKIHKVKVQSPPKSKKSPKQRATAILQISDPHFNTTVDLEHSKYNTDIIASRMYEYIQRAKNILSIYNIDKVIVALTGDLINSDRRLDEKMTMVNSRSKAMIIATNIISDAIFDMASDYQCEVYSVVGNESRIKDEHSYSPKILEENYDAIIYDLLKHIFLQSKVDFPKDGSGRECVVNVYGKNILLLHGDTLKVDVYKSTKDIISKYNSYGIILDYILCGHFHSHIVSPYFARSGSMMRGDYYSDAHNYFGVSSQLLTIVEDNGLIYSIPILFSDENKKSYKYDKTLLARGNNGE